MYIFLSINQICVPYRSIPCFHSFFVLSKCKTLKVFPIHSWNLIGYEWIIMKFIDHAWLVSPCNIPIFPSGMLDFPCAWFIPCIPGCNSTTYLLLWLLRFDTTCILTAVLTSSLFTVSRPSLCSLPTAFDFHTYALFRKPLPPFVSALFREPMHSLSRFYVIFRGPVLTLLPPSFGTVCPLPGTIINLIFTPLPGGGGSVLKLFHPLPGAFIYISALFWGIFLPYSGGFQWPYFRSLPGACTKVISSHFQGSF